jgi:hypothetical protein
MSFRNLKMIFFILLLPIFWQQSILFDSVADDQALSSTISTSDTRFSTSELTSAISERITKVDEFRFIREEAQKLGVRAYLFGGTASGFGHYVKWDLEREKGDTRYQKERFDYEYTNMYRSNQDLDIVIDGSPAQAQKLEAVLQQKYPHLQGAKSAWEVRLLKQKMGDKEALLNNADFLNQHTDSNSTGLIEITKPVVGESAVKDLRDWDSNEPFFLKDIKEGKIHYYFSSDHAGTSRSKSGLNPPILSVIRYLTKAFQYDLQLRPEDLDKIKKIIADFDPKKDTQNFYVANWIEKNGKKLFQNAVNIEYAWDTLEKLGLRKKLESIKNNTHETESLSWWMSKEPLRSKPLGTSGETAEELFKRMGWNNDLMISHETKSLSALESITLSKSGEANVLISRDGQLNEAANFGDGFYTRVGKEGARRTGLTIRSRLNPSARVGVDFIVVNGDHLIIKNKTALKIIPESLSVSPFNFFDMFIDGKFFHESDKGILERTRNQIRTKMSTLSRTDQDLLFKKVMENGNVKNLVKEYIDLLPKSFVEKLTTEQQYLFFQVAMKDPKNDDLLNEYLKLSRKFSVQEQDLFLQTAIDVDKNKMSPWLKEVLSTFNNTQRDLFFQTAVDAKNRDALGMIYRFSPKLTHEQRDLFFQAAIGNSPNKELWNEYLKLSSDFSPELRDLFLKAAFDIDKDEMVKKYFELSPKFTKEQREVFLQLALENTRNDQLIYQYLNLSPKLTGKQFDTVLKVILENEHKIYLLKSFLKLFPKLSPEQFDWIFPIVLKNKNDSELIADYLKLSPQLSIENEAKLFKVLMGSYGIESARLYHDSMTKWKDHPEWVEALIMEGSVDDRIAMNILSNSHWKDRPEWVEQLIKQGDYKAHAAIADYVLTEPHWRENSKLVMALIEGVSSPNYGVLRNETIKRILKDPYLRSQQQVLEVLLKMRYITKDQADGYGLETTSSKLMRNCSGLFGKLFGGR